MMNWQNLLHKVQQMVGLGSTKSFHRATEQDVYYCYRLFFNREPDPEGLQFYIDLVHNHHVTIEFLTDSFLYSDELQKIQQERDTPQLVELEAFKIYVRTNDYFIGAPIQRGEIYEPAVTQLLQQWLKPDMVFVDIGANIGYFSLLAAARVGPQGQVYAFEPVPANCKLLTQSIQANLFENIQLHPVAVAESRQIFSLDMGGKNSNSRLVEASPTAVQVESVALDDVLGDLTHVDIVKMDIEGAEPRALRGMTQLLKKHRPRLVVEFSPDLIRVTSGSEPAAFLDELQTLGYQLYLIPATPSPNAPLDKPLDTADIMQLCQSLTTYDHVDLRAHPVP